MSGVDIGTIEIDKSSDGYHQLMAVTKDMAATKIGAETQDYVERLRIQREEGQYAQHKQTQSTHLGAFQTEKQAEVGIAGAQALGQMGASGAGNVDLGGGMNMAAVMTSMAVGSAVGQNIAGAMNNVINESNRQQTNIVPPSIPPVMYHVAINGQAVGPFDIQTLTQMAANGQITSESLVWKPGMPQWVSAREINTLKELFARIQPIQPLPKECD